MIDKFVFYDLRHGKSNLGRDLPNIKGRKDLQTSIFAGGGRAPVTVVHDISRDALKRATTTTCCGNKKIKKIALDNPLICTIIVLVENHVWTAGACSRFFFLRRILLRGSSLPLLKT